MGTIKLICGVLIFLFGALYSYRTVYIIVGIFKTKKFKKAKKYHKYAILIPARNEETVLGNLLESIEKQDYPRDMIEVFVVADNSSDSTAEIARRHGAHCYERFDRSKQTKGYALQFLFKQIKRDFGIESFEGYFIFDSDNLLKSDYIRKMNDAFDSGEKIITSYRGTKNFDDNIISSSYALHWLRTARCESRARSFLGITTWVQGCGFLFSSEIVRGGWNYVTLAEDRAFSIDAILDGYSISYQHDAIFYDEQPTDAHTALRQRTRWAKGHLEAFRDYALELFLGIFLKKSFREKLNCFDMFMTTLPYVLVLFPLKALNYIALFGITLEAGIADEEVAKLAIEAVKLLMFEHLGLIPMAFLVFFFEHRRIAKMGTGKMLLFSLTFPIFSIFGDIATWAAIFKDVKWEPIAHRSNIKIGALERKI